MKLMKEELSIDIVFMTSILFFAVIAIIISITHK